jgi:hypothetical protein
MSAFAPAHFIPEIVSRMEFCPILTARSAEIARSAQLREVWDMGSGLSWFLR